MGESAAMSQVAQFYHWVSVALPDTNLHWWAIDRVMEQAEWWPWNRWDMGGVDNTHATGLGPRQAGVGSLSDQIPLNAQSVCPTSYSPVASLNLAIVWEHPCWQPCQVQFMLSFQFNCLLIINWQNVVANIYKQYLLLWSMNKMWSNQIKLINIPNTLKNFYFW